jgi:hypothetical protein
VNHSKLIAVLCARTKKALERTKRAYFQLYDRDIRKVFFPLFPLSLTHVSHMFPTCFPHVTTRFSPCTTGTL